MAESPSPDDFAALVKRACAGDGEALVQLIKRYEADVRIAVRVRLGAALRPYLDTVDLFQSMQRELLEKIRQGKLDLEKPEDLIGLAVRIVQRKIARAWQKNRRQERLPEAAGSSRDPLDLLGRLCSSDSDPQLVAQRNEAINQFYNSLDCVDRELIQLRVDGFTIAEAARRMGVNASMLRNRLIRLRKRLMDSNLLGDWL